MPSRNKTEKSWGFATLSIHLASLNISFNISELALTVGATSPHTSFYQHMTYQSLPPAGHHFETASAFTLTFFFDFVFQ
jgi:hypothetical protein